MAKVTSKLQVTVPKALAERYRIAPGDEIEWEAAGDAIRVVPRGARPAPGVASRLRLFDQATARQLERDRRAVAARAADRGWTRGAVPAWPRSLTRTSRFGASKRFCRGWRGLLPIG